MTKTCRRLRVTRVAYAFYHHVEDLVGGNGINLV